MSDDEFANALGADVVISGVGSPGPVGALEALAVGQWWERNRHSITCPVCHMTSYNPADIEFGYCGHCAWWTSDPVLAPYPPPPGP